MKAIFKFIVSLFLYLITQMVWGQENHELLISALQKEGFEQVTILKKSAIDAYILSYEHRGLRNPQDILKIVHAIGKMYDIDIQAFIPLFMGKPIGYYEIIGGNITADEVTEYQIENLKHQFQLQKYRFNAVILPQLQTRFGYFEDPFQIKWDMILGSTFMMGRGFGLHTGFLLPIQNNLDNQPNNLRLAPTFLSHFSTLLNHHYMLTNVGLFFNDRYGMDVQYRYADPMKRWSLGTHYARTGFYFLPPSGLYVDAINDQMALFDIEYFFPKEQVTAKVQIGQFMFKDRGIRVDFIRQYGELDVGFYTTQTFNGSNMGFMIHLPLLPKKIIRNQTVELRMTESFRWEYFYNNEGNVGRKFRSGAGLSDVLRQHRVSFINHINNN